MLECCISSRSQGTARAAWIAHKYCDKFECWHMFMPWTNARWNIFNKLDIWRREHVYYISFGWKYFGEVDANAMCILILPPLSLSRTHTPIPNWCIWFMDVHFNCCQLQQCNFIQNWILNMPIRRREKTQTHTLTYTHTKSNQNSNLIT